MNYIDLLTMIALTCTNIAVDGKTCTENLIKCTTSSFGNVKNRDEIRECVLKEIKDERERNKRLGKKWL